MRTATLEEYPGYEFREDGTVWSRRRGGPRTPRAMDHADRMDGPWRQLKGCIKPDGYVYVKLRREDWSRASVLLHRLVLTAFVGQCPSGMEACHNNGCKTDCRLENLRWDTPKANNADKVIHGTQKQGEDIPVAKLTNVQVRMARAIWAEGNHTYTELGKLFGVTREAMRKIVLRITYRETA